ncbi:DMT family transporter [Acrocarpospora catenulata]|uniref:DMT family transporter n=1 Tax=Acrocarpospora catenulata TaxID=2836182 RepID=UPI001BD99587|nr:DMT family transporter [Acrocarpospora catenulata]
MTVLAAAVALVGSMFFALGAAFQQFEAATGNESSLRVLLRRPRWLLGGAAITVGAGLHIFALSLGPLTVVQPMGVASLLFALPIAAALHGRRPARGELAAACAVSAGLIALVLMVPKATEPPHLSGPAGAFLLASAALAALLCWGLAARAAPAARTALLAVGAGVMYGATATLVRVLVEGARWDLWLIAAIPLPALVALMLLQRAYAVGHFGVAFAALQVSDPLTAVTFGALLLDEPLPSNGLAALAAATLAGAGTVALARTTPLKSP